MLGKTAGGLFWMFRYLERSENTARLIQAGFRIALTRPDGADDEWASVLKTAGVADLYHAGHDGMDAARVINFLLRDTANPSSVMSAIAAARQNARLVRTAITREVWEAVNDTYMILKQTLARPVAPRNLPEVLGMIRQQSALVRGATHGTMLRNDMFDFCRIGTFLERADNTARILDVKYYVLLPSISQIGSNLDNVQWETILRSVAGQRAYRWISGGESSPMGIANFLIFDGRMPRSLKFTIGKLATNLGYLEREYDARHRAHDMVEDLAGRLSRTTIEQVFDEGLHEYIVDFLRDLGQLGAQVNSDYRFLG
ncbi:alpha-E domain-containing protein [Rhodophyticola sp. CCM32]|uniref:alpha-E domain-containing protein n=1 Tax=Rhodophyticola sp. CCM32 TaxID=2916397 RepID=UPI00107F9C3E|nr:alpha-E domain-containing protein [Rhodophyticola sp. CCM32]QBX99728.1 alpha-E domain-containing protein [Rhodophyticola sp. CCM32]